MINFKGYVVLYCIPLFIVAKNVILGYYIKRKIFSKNSLTIFPK